MRKIVEIVDEIRRMEALANEDPSTFGNNHARAGLVTRRGQAQLQLPNLRRELSQELVNSARFVILDRIPAGKLKRLSALAESDENVVVTVSALHLYEQLVQTLNVVDQTALEFSAIHWYTFLQELQRWCEGTARVFDFQIPVPTANIGAPLPSHGTARRTQRVVDIISTATRAQNGTRLEWIAVVCEAGRQVEEALSEQKPTRSDQPQPQVTVLVTVPEWDATTAARLMQERGVGWRLIRVEDLPGRDKLTETLVRDLLFSDKEVSVK